MPLENLSAAVLLIGIIAYAVLGGADFGAGVWTALATGKRAREQREAVFRAIGPVWETNHVWLIVVVVILFTAFPPAFADLFTALLVPLVIAVLGIVLRGAAFAFQHFGHDADGEMPGMGAVFSASSIITPLAMGMALGAVAGGQITIEDGEVTSGLYQPWLGPFSILCGVIAVVVCAFLSASYMTARTGGELQEDFRGRALASGLALAALLLIALPVAYWDADALWNEIGEAAPIVVMSVAFLAILASLVVLWRRWYLLGPPAAAAAVALVFGGWAAAQYPFLVLPNERIADVAAGDSMLGAVLIALLIGALILVPSIVLLYLTFSEKTGGPGVEDARFEY